MTRDWSRPSSDPEINAASERLLKLPKMARLGARFFAVNWDYVSRKDKGEVPPMAEMFKDLATPGADGTWALTQAGQDLLSMGRQMRAIDREDAEEAARRAVDESKPPRPDDGDDHEFDEDGDDDD